MWKGLVLNKHSCRTYRRLFHVKYHITDKQALCLWSDMLYIYNEITAAPYRNA